MDEIETTKDNVIPNFHLRPVKNNFRSKQEGRPIWENREYVEMLIPGNTTERPCMPVRQEHKDRWPDQYDRFIKKQEQGFDGTPLEQWPIMDPARVSALKDSNIYTVDQLAQLPDGQGKSVGPDFHELKQKAQKFLGAAENSANDQKIEDLQARLEALEAENAELRQNQKKKPGRPKKQAETA